MSKRLEKALARAPLAIVVQVAAGAWCVADIESAYEHQREPIVITYTARNFAFGTQEDAVASAVTALLGKDN